MSRYMDLPSVEEMEIFFHEIARQRVDCVDLEVQEEEGTTCRITAKLNEKATKTHYFTKLRVYLDYENPDRMEVPITIIVRPQNK